MTTHVSAFTLATVNSDQEPQHEESESELKYSLPIAPRRLRLSSETLGTVEKEEKILLKNRESNQSVNGRSGCGSPEKPNKEPGDEVTLVKEEKDEKTAIPDRRDSGAGDSSVDADPEVVARIISLVETIFSDDNLIKDVFLLKHIRRRSDGFISLKLIAGLRKVKQITREFPVVLMSLKKSEKLEVNADETKVRRKVPLPPALKEKPIKRKDKSQPMEETPLDIPNEVGIDNTDKEKENLVDSGNHHGNGSGSPSLTDEQQIARTRRQGGHLNELQFERSSSSKPSSGWSSVGETPQVLNRGRIGGSSRRSTGNYPYPKDPNGLPPKGPTSLLGAKPSSTGTDPPAASMSSWLQKRRASLQLCNAADAPIVEVIRQPHGPDGTRGFHPGHRQRIVEERLQNHAQMAHQLS